MTTGPPPNWRTSSASTSARRCPAITANPRPTRRTGLVYLLDHEYTPRALKWSRLKGADASRASVLREAANRADCEAILALADIKTTHSAFKDSYDDYRYGRRWDDDYDEDEYDDDDDSRNDSQYEIQELIDSEVALTHWTGPDGTRLEESSLPVDGAEVCASTPTGDLEAYSSEYEGYMGNWGNTLDRWYHRAAVVVWPREQAFANRAETSPAWALDELAAMASAGDVPGAQATAATLAPFGDTALRGRAPEEGDRVSGLFGKALRAADAVADAETAAMLRPFRTREPDRCARELVREDRRRVRSAVDGGPAADVVRRGSAGVGIRRGTGTAPVGGGLAAWPLRGAAGHGQRRRVGRAADP